MPHLKTKIAEYGVIIKDNKFLILQFSRRANERETWIFPGGRINENEKHITGLKREVSEETGLQVEVQIPCGVTMWGEGEDNRYAVFFLCKVKGKQTVVLSKEHQDYRWCSFDELASIRFHDSSFVDILNKAKVLVKISH
ncbi:MAG: NUDIX domain-containing protein [Nanobdellota archaeon]